MLYNWTLHGKHFESTAVCSVQSILLSLPLKITGCIVIVHNYYLTKGPDVVPFQAHH